MNIGAVGNCYYLTGSNVEAAHATAKSDCETGAFAVTNSHLAELETVTEMTAVAAQLAIDHDGMEQDINFILDRNI